MNDTVLVTGGAGFIGSHVVEGYLGRGYRVVVLDNFSSGQRENLPSGGASEHLTVVDGDVRDKVTVSKLFAEFRPAVINHHAAQKSVPDSMNDPLGDLSINLQGLLNVIEGCRDGSVKKFIFVSSGGVLSKEITGAERSRESDAPQLKSPYGITKYAGEKYVAIYAELYGYDYTILRYSNVYGPRQIKDGECGVVPIFAENLLADVPSTLMAYEDMPAGCTRDYVNVLDVAAANMLATETNARGVFNIGTGTEISISELYRQMAVVFGSGAELRKAPARPGDVRRSVLDCTEAERQLGWRPSVSLAEGLAQLKQFYAHG